MLNTLDYIIIVMVVAAIILTIWLVIITFNPPLSCKPVEEQQLKDKQLEEHFKDDEVTISSILKMKLNFIENKEHYYAMFQSTLEACSKAELANLLLYEREDITYEKFNENVTRIKNAKEHAIKTHGEWTIKAFERSETQHTPRTFVSSVYSDIWGIELKEEEE